MGEMSKSELKGRSEIANRKAKHQHLQLAIEFSFLQSGFGTYIGPLAAENVGACFAYFPG